MGYLTEAHLANTLDLPVTLAATQLNMGDWLQFAAVKLVQPYRLRFRMLNLQLHESSVDINDISSSNLIYGNLGLVYVALRLDYLSGTPGQSSALDTVVASSVGMVARDLDNELVLTTPGTYSWFVANNCQPNSASSIPAATSIDFTLSVTGQVRMELETS